MLTHIYFLVNAADCSWSVCVCVRLDFLSDLLTAASEDGVRDTFLRKGRRQGAITLLTTHFFSPPSSSSSSPTLLISCAVEPKCLRQMSAASCLKPSTRAAELGKLIKINISIFSKSVPRLREDGGREIVCPQRLTEIRGRANYDSLLCVCVLHEFRILNFFGFHI